MFTVLFPFLKKCWPYVAAAGVFFSAGSYVGYRLELGAVEVQKLALATQQRNDAAAIAAANAIAASELAQADAKANAVEAQLAAANAQAGTQDTTLTAQIAAQATQPGQDAADSPVLAATLDELAKGNP
jgi:hypothetical protein